MNDFTLENLVERLAAAGHVVVKSGPESLSHITELRSLPELADFPLPRATFFAIVESSEDLMDASTRVMENVWAAFGRGNMEFNCELVDGKARICITEIDKNKSKQ